MLTKAEAIRRHRLMWNWIAQTSIQEQRCVKKREVFKHFGWNIIHCWCWCCGYDRQESYKETTPELLCAFCPVDWNTKTCIGASSYFRRWQYAAIRANDYITAAKYAYMIAELPERKDV